MAVGWGFIPGPQPVSRNEVPYAVAKKEKNMMTKHSLYVFIILLSIYFVTLHIMLWAGKELDILWNAEYYINQWSCCRCLRGLQPGESLRGLLIFFNEKRGESCRAKVFFRNICAHGERLYSYKTKNAIPDFPIHDKLGIIKKESNMNVENMICLRS